MAPNRIGLALLMLLAGAAHAAGPVLIDGLAPDANGSFDANLCRGCTADRAVAGLCANDCMTCRDAGRTTFAGDNSTTGCGQFDGNQPACEDAWSLSGDGVAFSCFYQGGSCFPCSGDNQLLSLCTNSCLPCADAARTTYAGGPFPDSCRAFDGNQAGCDTAWQLTNNGVPNTCFYVAGECHACGVSERLANLCTNTCTACADAGRTSYVNGFGDDGCVALAENQGACESTWYLAAGFVPATCFYTDGTEVNRDGFLFIQDGFDRVGPLVTNGKTLAVCLGCNATTAVEGFDHGFDESTLPGLGWTRTTLTERAHIEAFFENTGQTRIADTGLVYMPSQQTDGPHGGLGEEQLAEINAHVAALAAFVAGGGGLFAHSQARLAGGFAWLDDVLPGVTARPGNTCRDALAFTPSGTASFPQVTNGILQTLNAPSPSYFLGDPGPLAVLAEDQCRDVGCKNASHPNLLPETGDAACTALANDAAACDAAWYLTRGGLAAICSATAPGTCLGCGRTEEGEDPCPNACHACDDPTRTNYTGDLSTPGCEGLGADQTACATAWMGGGDGLNASCFFDADAGFCRACTTENENLGLCTNACEPPPATRTVVLGPGGTTTTTLPPGACQDEEIVPTFESILCALDRLVALVDAAQDLGKTKKQLSRAVTKARAKTVAAQGLVGGKKKKVKNALHKASRRMVSFNFRVRSRTGQNVIPQPTRDALNALGLPILDNMRMLLKSL